MKLSNIKRFWRTVRGQMALITFPKEMKIIKKIFIKISSTLLLLCLICSYASTNATSTYQTLFSDGWELWETTIKWNNSVTLYEITCPEVNVSALRMQALLLDIMSYCKEKDPLASSITIRFTYNDAEFSSLSSEVSGAINTATGLRTVCCSFLNISSCKIKAYDNKVSQVIVTLDINNPESASIFAKDVPYGEALEAARILAEKLEAETSDKYQQIELLNDYLMRNVSYGGDGNGREHSTVGALLDGKAMCAGFTNAVSDVCYLLDIPCYQLNDTKNRHIWNVIQIDGKWLMLDCTWNSSLKSAQYFLLEQLDDGLHYYAKETCVTIQGYIASLQHTGGG